MIAIPKKNSYLDIDKHAQKIKQATKTISKEYRKNITTAVLTGLAFVIGFYIKDVIQQWIEYILEVFNLSQGTGLIYKTIVALIVVGMAVIIMVVVSKWSVEEKKE